MDLCPDDVAVQRLVLVHLQYHPGFGDAYCGDGKVGGGNGEAGDVAVQRLVLVHLYSHDAGCGDIAVKKCSVGSHQHQR